MFHGGLAKQTVCHIGLMKNCGFDLTGMSGFAYQLGRRSPVQSPCGGWGRGRVRRGRTAPPRPSFGSTQLAKSYRSTLGIPVGCRSFASLLALSLNHPTVHFVLLTVVGATEVNTGRRACDARSRWSLRNSSKSLSDNPPAATAAWTAHPGSVSCWQSA